MVSIIVPSYNCAKYIGETIDSILLQTYRDFELIIIDDGSSDKTKEILSQYTDKRIQIVYDDNHGVCHARNHGLDLAKGEYIALIDDDDIIEPTYIEKLINAISGNEYARCNYNKMSNGKLYPDNIILSIPKQTSGVELLQKTITSIENLQGLVWSSLLKKEIIDKYKIRFDEELSFGEDLLFSTEYLSHINKASIIHEALYNYRINAGSTSNKYMRKMQSSLIRTNEKLSPIINRIDDELISTGFIRVKANDVLICFYNNRNKGNPFSRKERKLELKKMIDIPEYYDAIKYEIHNPLKGKYWLVRNLHYRLLLLSYGYTV